MDDDVDIVYNETVGNMNVDNNNDYKEDKLLDEMLCDVLKMKELDINDIQQMNAKNKDSESDESDNMYEIQENEEQKEWK